MKIPQLIQRLLSGAAHIDAKRDLQPRRICTLRNKMIPPRISIEKQVFYSKCLVALGRSPSDFGLPQVPPTPALQHPQSPTFTQPRLSVYRAKVQKLRECKIRFVKAQMSRMPEIIEEWRAKRRADRALKAKKYPF